MVEEKEQQKYQFLQRQSKLSSSTHSELSRRRSLKEPPLLLLLLLLGKSSWQAKALAVGRRARGLGVREGATDAGAEAPKKYNLTKRASCNKPSDYVSAYAEDIVKQMRLSLSVAHKGRFISNQWQRQRQGNKAVNIEWAPGSSVQLRAGQ